MQVLDRFLNKLMEGRDILNRCPVDKFFRSDFVKKAEKLSKEQLEIRIRELEIKTIPEKKLERTRWSIGKKIFYSFYGNPVSEKEYLLGIFKEVYETK